MECVEVCQNKVHFHTIKSILNYESDIECGIKVVDFHTIKSILNNEPTLFIANTIFNFHTIKSILNSTSQSIVSPGFTLFPYY